MSANLTMSPEINREPEEDLQQPSRGVEHNKAKRKWLKLVLRTSISMLLIAFLIKAVSWSTLFTTLAHAHHGALLMGLAVGILCVFLSAYSWHALVHAERIPTDLARLINLYLVGIAFSHFLPSSMGGDVAKAYYVGRDSGNMVGSTSAVLMSRLIGFLGMLLIAIPTLLLWRNQFKPEIIVSFLLLSLLLALAIAGVILLSILLPRISNRFMKARWASYRVTELVIQTGQALGHAARRPRSLGIAISFSILFWLASFLNYYGYATALGMQVPLPFYVITISLASIVAFFPITINGFGLREGILVYAFSTVQVSPSMSLLLAFLMDIQVLFFGLIGGCIYLAMGTKSNKNIYEVQDE